MACREGFMDEEGGWWLRLVLKLELLLLCLYAAEALYLGLVAGSLVGIVALCLVPVGAFVLLPPSERILLGFLCWKALVILLLSLCVVVGTAELGSEAPQGLRLRERWRSERTFHLVSVVTASLLIAVSLASFAFVSRFLFRLTEPQPTAEEKPLREL